jgi:predicted O-linked N-acetylglucosamine transferase (SPINDLY family)
MGIGRTDEGIGLLRKAADLAPDSPIVGSILLWNLHYLPGQTRKMFYAQYRRWGQSYAPTGASKRPYRNVPDPDRKLRIGYVSPDFHVHSAAHSFEPFLDGYDRDKLQVYGYGYVKRPDETTRRFQQRFDCYRDIHAMHYEKTARLIEQDEIDILVEMGGHSDNNCLGVLKYKPAPIQVDHGGIDTSGMEQIDYRLTDELLDPPHLQKFYVEQSICLPGGLASFRPARTSPLVSPLPAQRNGYVTFGSFNNNIKISDDIMSLWAQILKATGDSRLVLKFIAGNDQGVRDHYVHKLAQLGINRERVQIYGTMPHFEHLRLLGQVDIALDTYPYNGCITTLEGFWMGLPIVTLMGEHYVSRVGYSILSRIGLEIFAALTSREYVDKAVAFASQLENLAAIRASLRQRLLESDLCDPRRLAREMESAFRGMWYRWCRSQGVNIEDKKPERTTRTVQPANAVMRHSCDERASV